MLIYILFMFLFLFLLLISAKLNEVKKQNEKVIKLLEDKSVE
ncbi:hypothetical protein [Natranaerobius thermophilus]|uniref:Uncharacterized protein n=1 Tax=Natranaerobius thermophilus (strain ATCC BAA-1301 / DSM 18059 / JW/NM-WN-LF) TaxID=457570 RepID=B2A122_NATTJ|nr:hypothetical protein [Natranaerobius thermophilus]ACB84645.1 hypothetical protein Nther_1061 [Natranaerobius thermophilus JW/NM-WN-LF]